MRTSTLLFLLFAILLTAVPAPLRAQTDDPVKMLKIQVQAYQKLIEMRNLPGTAKAVQVVADRFPQYFTDGNLASQVVTAVASTKALPPGVTKDDILKARAAVQGRGHFEKLKDKELRDALIEISWTHRLSVDIEKYAEESVALFGGAKTNALARACVANMKTVSGAMEMYALDKNQPPPVGSTDELMAALTGGSYLTSDIRFCGVDKKTPLEFSMSGTTGVVSCPQHGSSENPRGTGNVDKAAVERARQTNPVVWAILEVMGGPPR